MKPPNICPPLQTEQPASVEQLNNTNNESTNNLQITKPQITIASQIQQVPLALTTQCQIQSATATTSSAQAAKTPSPAPINTTAGAAATATTTTTTTATAVAAATQSTATTTAQPSSTSSTTPAPKATPAPTSTSTVANSSQPLTLVTTPLQLQAPIKTTTASQLHNITPVPMTAHQQLTVLINRQNVPIVPIAATASAAAGGSVLTAATTNQAAITTLPLAQQQITATTVLANITGVPTNTTAAPLTTTQPISLPTTATSSAPISATSTTLTGSIPTIAHITTTLPTSLAPSATIQATTTTPQNINSTSNIKSETNKYICCLLDNGIRCNRVACNASFSARIQKIVGTKKMNFALDPTVRHAYICEHHKNIITVAKKSATLGRETKANARNSANNNALAAATVVVNNYNDLSMRQQQQQQGLQHPVNLEVMKNQSRSMNNHNAGALNTVPMRQGQATQMAYGHYPRVMSNQVGGNMDVMMSTSFDNTGGDTGLGVPTSSGGGNSGVEVDLQQLQVNTLRRYKRHFRVQTRPGLNKLQLAESLKCHFKTLPIIEKEAITYFVYIVKCYRNKLDHNPKAD